MNGTNEHEGREVKPARKWLDKFGLHSRKNHGINAHLKPRLYFVKYEDAEQAIEALTKQLADQMNDYHTKIASLINEKAELREQLAKERALIKRFVDSMALLEVELLKERALRKELYQATYDWTDHMDLWMEERKFRIDNADLDVLKKLIRQGQKAIQKSKSLD